MRDVVAVVGDRVDLARLGERLGSACPGGGGLPWGRLSLDGAAPRGIEGSFTLDGSDARVVFDERGPTFVADAHGRRRWLWTRVAGVHVVASDAGLVLRARRALGASSPLDGAAFGRFLRFSFVPEPSTPWSDVHVLPPRASWTRAEVVVAEPPSVVVRDLDDDEAADAAWAALRETTEQAPPAVLLSSGVDSSLVAACLRPGATAVTLDLGGDASEAPAAARVAQALGHRVHVVPVRDEAVLSLVERATRALDVPIGDPVVVPFVAAADALRDLGHDAVTTGEGGDQAFAGWSTRPLLAALSYGPPVDELPALFAGTFHKLGDLEGEAFVRPEARCMERLVAPWFTEDRLARAGSLFALLARANLDWKGAQNVAVRIERVLASSGVRHVAPFFDPRVVDLAMSLPMRHKVRGTTDKWILRRRLVALGLHEVAGLPKRGMQAPVRAWLEGPLAALHRDLLASPRARIGAWVSTDLVRRLLDDDVVAPDLRRRRRDEWLWLLLAAELWLAEHDRWA